LLPVSESGALAAISAAKATARSASFSGGASSVTIPHSNAAAALTLRPVKNSSRVRATPTASMNLRMPVCE
jgi:hypothetical protein